MIVTKYPDWIEALKQAIKALEQQTSEDCISREAVIKHICESKECYKDECKGRLYKRCFDLQWIYDLPSVTPTISKMGQVEDCVSRGDVINAIKSEDELSFMGAFCSHDCAMGFIETIKELPSVTPQQKVGKWIIRPDRASDIEYRCSECGKIQFADDTNELNYCCNCGAKMEVSE